MLGGLAGLAHLYGLFLLPVFCLALVWNRGARWVRHSALLLGGALLVWFPYLLYVLSDLTEWRGQTQGYAPRFDILNPAWYWNNITRELMRYAIGWHSDAPLLLRAGFWFVLLYLPLGLWLLARRAFLQDRRSHLLFVSPLVFPISYRFCS